MSAPIVELRNVSKSFGQGYALKDVSLAVQDNEIVALLGDNGAGKSTLIKLISGVHAPDSGEIYVHGKLVNKWSSARARLNGIETVYQDKALAEQQAVTRNLFMGRELTTHFGFLKLKQQRTEAEALMRRIGFTSKVMSADSPVATLSGGERQGVAIARALHFKADLIILDEPTTALSLTQARRVLDFVRVAKTEGTSSIFITHNVYHGHEVGDRLIVLDRGQIAAEFRKGDVSVIELIKRLQLVAAGRPQARGDTQEPDS
jgi:simple sugar transport system ATP-binding protein